MKLLSADKNKMLAGYLYVTIVVMTSCQKLIEIPGNPPTMITKEQQYADSVSVVSAVAGAYTYSQSNGFGYSDANLTIATGLSADELSTTMTSNDNPQFYSYTLTPINRSIVSLWQYPYQGMYQVNDILDGIANNSRLSVSLIAQITGEMKVARALYYFNMVNLFGGVPLVTSTDYKTTAHLPRASIDAVYSQILNDLTDAIKLLKAEYPSSGRARPNLYAAKALLAKVYLYRGQWQAAYNEATDIIDSKLYSVTEVPLNAVFLEGSNEAIWQLPVKNSYQQTADAQNFVPSTGSIPRYPVTPFLLDQFEQGDKRLDAWIGRTVANNRTFSYPFKYKNRLAGNVPVENYMVFRLGEVLLIRAEAAARINDLEGAMEDMNIIRTRAGLAGSTADASSQESVLNAIMHERQTELCFEWGNRWFDLKRNVTPSTSAATVLGAIKTGYNPDAALYPIPQAQRLLNNNLEQNQGYN